MLSDPSKTLRSLASRLTRESIATAGITPTTAFDDSLYNQANAFCCSSDVPPAYSRTVEVAASKHGQNSTSARVNREVSEGVDRRTDAIDSRSFAPNERHTDKNHTDSRWRHLVHRALKRRSLAPGTSAVQVDDSSRSLDTESGINHTLSVLPTATPAIATGRTLADALPVSAVSSPQTVNGFVGTTAPDSYYRFTLSTTSKLNVLLSNLTADADLQLIQDTNHNGIVDTGEVISSSSNPSTQPETIATNLTAGTYFIDVHQYSGDTHYTLQTQATTIPTPVGYNTTYGYGLVDAGRAIATLTGQVPSPLPTSNTNAWDLNLVDAPAAWAKGYTGQGVVVAVVDTGVDATHPDLSNNIWTNPGEIPGNGIDDDHNGFVDDVHGWDFVDRDNTPTDSVGHGTHVAGTIAAEPNSFGITGVAYNAKIMPVRVLGDSGGSDLDVAAGIRYAADNKAGVINLSLGGSASSAIASAVQYATQKGSLVVMAAGNDGGNQPVAPANLASQWGIAVGAIDRNKTLADFSDRAGAIPLNYVVAPGVNIVSTTPNNTYQSLSGTSMAAPHVSGVAALLLSANPKLTPLQLTSLLTTDATTQGLTMA